MLRVDLKKKDDLIDKLELQVQLLRATHDELGQAHVEFSDFVRDETDHLRKLIIAHQRRLQALELKEAQFGINTPVEIAMESEDIREKIRDLQMTIEETLYDSHDIRLATERIRKQVRKAETRTDYLINAEIQGH